KPTIEAVRQWAARHASTCEFRLGDITSLPYDSESLSGYLSFGVIEHFREGPSAALVEANRVLRPGGVALISTQSVSFAQLAIRLARAGRDVTRRLLGRQVPSRTFFQYWFSPGTLR